MKPNTLVTHNEKPEWGIGVVCHKGKKKNKIIFADHNAQKVVDELLTEVDTSKCKTVSFKDFAEKKIFSESKKCPETAILGEKVMHFVGIGWMELRSVKEEDLTEYPRVVRVC